MGFYTNYCDGDMIISSSAFPQLREALPSLLEKYQVENVDQVPSQDQARYEEMLKDRDSTWVGVAKAWLALPDEIRPFLSLMRALAHSHGYFVDYGKERVNGEEIEGFKISFDEKKNWEPNLLFDLGPFLLPGTYIQVDDDAGNIRRYVAKDGNVECIYPSWN